MNESISSLMGMVIGVQKPSTAMMRTIAVVVSNNQCLANYASGWVAEAARKAPLTFNLVGLTSDEMVAYAMYLLAKRIECVDRRCNDYRELKGLWIPDYIQTALRTIGEVIDRQTGFRLIPVLNPSDAKSIIKLDQALKISDKIRAFDGDLKMHKESMPPRTDGDLDVMSCAQIAGYVRARVDVKMPQSTYISVFAGLKLKEEKEFEVCYSRTWDDIEHVTRTLPLDSEIY